MGKQRFTWYRSGNSVYLLLALPVLIGVFIWGLTEFYFTQDDAYITFRYAANFADGQGLVWNVGERLEGYTNFFWLLLLIFFHSFGFEYLTITSALGPLFSILTILIFFQFGCGFTFGKSHESTSPRLLWLIPLGVTALLSFNYCFVYWTIAGLETPLFACLTAVAFWAYFRRSWLIVPALALALLTRPEGVLVAGFFPLFALIETRKIPTAELKVLALVTALLAPYLVFKWVYFGAILPNPFYAKTGWDLVQMTAGAEYVWEFLSNYALYGAVYLLPAVFYRSLPEEGRALYLFSALYTLYIALIGGDVLQVGRFFLPILGPLYLSFMLALIYGLRRNIVSYLAPALAIALALFLPNERVMAYLKQERGFSMKMSLLAEQMLAVDSSSFSLATPTIGKIGYLMLGHDIIDMVGLTDSTVARHPQAPIDGLVSSWRERKYNAEYILSRQPNYILFSTSVKPSSPGERALFLYPTFLKSYKPVGFFFGGRMNDAYQLQADSLGPIERTIDARFVQEYVSGIDELYGSGPDRLSKAMDHFSLALEYGPEGGYAYVYYFIGKCFAEQGRNNGAYGALKKSLTLDSTVYVSHFEIYAALRNVPSLQKTASFHRDELARLVPWAFRSLDSLINADL